MSNQIVSTYMSAKPFCVSPELSVREAMTEMVARQFNHLPIVEHGTLVGVVSHRDVKAALSLEQFASLTVGDIMTDVVYAVSQSMPINKVVTHMAKAKIGSAIVLSEVGRVVGIFTVTDALKLLAATIEDRAIEEYLIDNEGWTESV